MPNDTEQPPGPGAPGTQPPTKMIDPNTIATKLDEWGTFNVPGPPLPWVLERIEKNGWTFKAMMPVNIDGQNYVSIYFKCERMIQPASRLVPFRKPS